MPPPVSDARGVPRLADGDGDSIFRIDMGAFELLPTNGAIELSSFGETHFEDSGNLGAVESMLPMGWTASTAHVFNTTFTEIFPAASGFTEHTIDARSFSREQPGPRNIVFG